MYGCEMVCPAYGEWTIPVGTAAMFLRHELMTGNGLHGAECTDVLHTVPTDQRSHGEALLPVLCLLRTLPRSGFRAEHEPGKEQGGAGVETDRTHNPPTTYN
ncbi:hypothetical protein LCGC14_2789250, partial [marine sediment metagenome]